LLIQIIELVILKVYLVQHAQAKTKDEDPERPLSEMGRKLALRMAQYAQQHLNITVKTIYQSGKLRASQTADIFAEYLRCSEILESNDLEPLAEPSIWSLKLLEMEEDIMLVGHLPHLANLVTLLFSGQGEAKVVKFRNAGIVCLSREESDSWSLEWALTPEIIPWPIKSLKDHYPDRESETT
jgi:phosphohistidine phosphatase